MITDQQNINKNNYDTSVLPSKIEIIFIQRQDVISTVKKSILGPFIPLLTYTNSTINKYIKNNICNILLTRKITENINFNNTQLIVFNDRNRLARIFILCFKDYIVIEDGLSNYRGMKLKFVEKCLKKITSPKQKMRYVGDNSKCSNIFLLNPENAPEYIRPKTKVIQFIDHNLITKYCFPFFNVRSDNTTVQYIIATQPISSPEYLNSGTDLLVYKKIANYLTSKSISFSFKIHPREKTEKYANIIENADFIESKIPLELIILKSPQKIKIISVYSSAGMGFEKYCERITLINDNEVNNMNDTIKSWTKSIDMIDDRITEKLGSL